MGIRKLLWTVDVVSGHSGGVGQRLRGVGGLCGAAPERAVEPTTVVTNTSNETRAEVQAQGQQDDRRPHDDQLRKITLHKTTTPLRFIQTLMKHVELNPLDLQKYCLN